MEDQTSLVPLPRQPLAIPGSKPLRNERHERFCRLRAALCPKIEAYRRSVGNEDYGEHAARGNASKWERRADVQDRIAYLSRQDEELLQAKRQRIEEMLWLIHEANVADMWEMVQVPKHDAKGNVVLDDNGEAVMKWVQRPKPINEMPEDVQRAVEAMTINEAGFVIPKPYSKLQANAELRKLLGIGLATRDDGDFSRLSDAELVAQLAAQARELGIEVDLTYRFGGG